MPIGADDLSDQRRWDEKGTRRLEELAADPGRFLVSQSPHAHKVFRADLMARLGSLSGLEILEIGSGRGEFSVYLGRQGASVTGIDVGPNLVEASRVLAEINGVECRFVHSSATELPFDAESFDRVVGVAVLHHLSREDLVRAVRETHRVLRPGGTALFCEPIENSRLFDFLQNLVPVGGRGKGDYRPSILQRRAWAEHQRVFDERPLSERELVDAGGSFESVAIIRHYGLLSRLWRLLGRRSRRRLEALDPVLLRAFPPLRYLARTVLVEYRVTRERSVRTGSTLAEELQERALERSKDPPVEKEPGAQTWGLSGGR
jgi:SAM-dependent methyltransferase